MHVNNASVNRCCFPQLPVWHVHPDDDAVEVAGSDADVGIDFRLFRSPLKFVSFCSLAELSRQPSQEVLLGEQAELH